jgi:hypothetical protein
MSNRRDFLVGHPEKQSIANVSELISLSDLNNLIELSTDYENLQAMDLEFTNANQSIGSARQNIDTEIAAFDVLDRFLYDPDPIDKVDEYSAELNSVIGTTDLNPVNSVMAFGSKAVIDSVKFIKENDPEFELSSYETRIDELGIENSQLTAERNTLTIHKDFSNTVVNLAKDVEVKHETLQENLEKYREEVKLRSNNVERTFSIINSLNISSSGSLVPTNNVNLSELEARASHNLFLFTTACLKT